MTYCYHYYYSCSSSSYYYYCYYHYYFYHYYHCYYYFIVIIVIVIIAFSIINVNHFVLFHLISSYFICVFCLSVVCDIMCPFVIFFSLMIYILYSHCLCMSRIVFLLSLLFASSSSSSSLSFYFFQHY